jgi:hypothetical protein
MLVYIWHFRLHASSSVVPLFSWPPDSLKVRLQKHLSPRVSSRGGVVLRDWDMCQETLCSSDSSMTLSRAVGAITSDPPNVAKRGTATTSIIRKRRRMSINSVYVYMYIFLQHLQDQTSNPTFPKPNLTSRSDSHRPSSPQPCGSSRQPSGPARSPRPTSSPANPCPSNLPKDPVPPVSAPVAYPLIRPLQH